MSLLSETSAWKKLRNIEETCHRILSGQAEDVPFQPGRDVEIVAIRDLPPKKGLSYREGQCRLLHDLASIELQAMELGVRTLIEFPSAPSLFREELARITIEEAKHFRLCLEALELMGKPWGSYPIHIGLWQSVAKEDTLLDRILIVHRYLEGSGLDASDNLLNRLSGIAQTPINNVVKVIATDEFAHVQFGSRWYRTICKHEGIDAEKDFRPRLFGLIHRIPRRIERINEQLRLKVGFTPAEIVALNEVRAFWLVPQAERAHRNVKISNTLP